MLNTKSRNIASLATLTAIILLAFVARLTHIDAESLWVDEGFSYWAIRHDDMLRVIINDVHPPLYFFGLRAWAEVAGITELALRYFSLLPGLLSVAVIYHVAREVQRLRGVSTRGDVVPVLAALLLALADMEIYMAQTVRMYSWHVLWVLVSAYGLLRWMRTGERGALAGWVAANIALLYTQYMGLAFMAAQALLILSHLRGGRRRTGIAALGFAALTFVPWGLAVVAGQTANVGTGFNVPSTLASLWAWRVEWFTAQWALMIGLAVLGVVVLRYDARRRVVGGRVPVAASAFLLGWLMIPVVGAYIANFFTPILMDYRLTQITPAVALLIALGLGNLRGSGRVFLVAVIVLYGVVAYDTPRPRPPWRDVGLSAAEFAREGDLALAHVTPSGDWQMIYYFDRWMPDGVTWRSLRQWQLEEGDTYADGLPALLAEHPAVWFMHWSSDTSGFDALARTGHTQTARRAHDWLGNDLTVYRFDQLPDDALTAFASGLILRDAAIIADEWRLDLWWEAPHALSADYTISAILLDADGRLVAQKDSAPFIGQRPTSTFTAGEVVYDPRRLHPAEGVTTLPAGVYTVAVKTYTFTPDGLLDVPTEDGDEFFIVGQITLDDDVAFTDG